MSEPTYLLVHGAFHGAWCWRDLGAELERRGVLWTAVDLPSATTGADPATYLGDDVRELVEVANEIGPVILVGHSYGGTVVAEAAELVEDLRALMFVGAMVPEPGQSTTECAKLVDNRTKLDLALRVEDGLLRLDPELAGAALAQDCPEGVQRWLVQHLSTQTLASFRSPRATGDPDVWRRYVVCEFDQSVDPSLQYLLANRCDETITLPSGHSPYLSMPHSLADALLA